MSLLNMIKWLLLLTILSQSLGNSSQTLPIQKIHSSNFCPYRQATLEVIDQQALSALITDSNRVVLTDKPRYNIDDNAQLILIAAGDKANLAYGIELIDDNAQIKQRTLHLPIRFTEPDPNLLYGQALVSPCLVIQIPKADYDNIALRP